MRIEEKLPIEPSQVYRLAVDKQRNVPAKAGQGATVDEVALSHEARFRQELLARLRSLPEIREELVAELRRRLATGTYSVSNEELAEAIIREMRGQRSS